jgi:hypothetical protein
MPTPSAIFFWLDEGKKTGKSEREWRGRNAQNQGRKRKRSVTGENSVVTSLRFSFAFFDLDERYRDLSPIDPDSAL